MSYMSCMSYMFLQLCLHLCLNICIYIYRYIYIYREREREKRERERERERGSPDLPEGSAEGGPGAAEKPEAQGGQRRGQHRSHADAPDCASVILGCYYYASIATMTNYYW